MVTEQDIRKAYVRIRTIDNTIPDEVLNFMRDASIDRANKRDLNYFTRAEIQEHLDKYK